MKNKLISLHPSPTLVIAFWFFGLTLLSSLVLIYVNRAYLSADFYEIGDFAADSLLVQSAKHLQLLTGHYSRLGFNHPGPGLLYVLALGEWLFHDRLQWVPSPLAGQLIALWIFNACWISVIGLLLWQLLSSFAATIVATTLFFVLSAYYDYNIFIGLWFPHVFYLPFSALLLSLARLIRGRADALPVAVISGGFLVHGHASFLSIVSLMILATLAINWRLREREDLILSRRFFYKNKRKIMSAALIAIIFILPVALETIRNFPGPIAKYIVFGQHNHHHAPIKGLLFMASFWQFGITPIIIGLMAMVFFCMTKGKISIHEYSKDVILVLLTSSAVMLVYVLYGIDSLSPYLGVFYFSVPALAISIMSLQILPLRPTAPLLITIILLLGAGLPYIVRQVSQPAIYTMQYSSPQIPIYFQQIKSLNDADIVLDIENFADVWVTLVGIELYALRQQDLHFCIDGNWHILFTDYARCANEKIANGPRYRVSTETTPPTGFEPTAVNVGTLHFFRAMAH